MSIVVADNHIRLKIYYNKSYLPETLQFLQLFSLTPK